MNTTRWVTLLAGVGLVILAAWMLFTQAGVSRWIPIGVAAAALLLFIGVVMMGAPETLPSEHGTGHHGTNLELHRHHEHP